jgi:ketosteroid isomerase-like protein
MSRKKQLSSSADDAESAFYEAINRADIDALMALWADDEDVVCIHPGAPRLLGHAAIRASWEAIFSGGAMRLQTSRIHAVQNLMGALHNVVEIMTPQAAHELERHILATNIYVRMAQGWRIVCHHASLAPGRPAAEPPKAALLH